MERWVPLFEIFLNSPSPEGEASLWLQQQHHQPPVASTAPSPKAPHSSSHQATSAFLSLLQSPASIITSHPTSTSPPFLKRCTWIQTLPPTVQSRILSFLTVESHRFCSRRLRSLATQVLESGAIGGHFWVLRAARNLLDAVSASHPESSTVALEEGDEAEEFDALPQWLESTATATISPLLPWLPLSHEQLREMGGRRTADAEVRAEGEEDDDESKEITEDEEKTHFERPPVLDIEPLSNSRIIHDRASGLKAELLACDSASSVQRVAYEIQQFCLDSGVVGGVKNPLWVLGLIEPWEAEDEIASVLLSHLSAASVQCSNYWHNHVLCSIVLPKLLIMQSSASRALLSATINFCKLHPVAAVDALLIPVVLCKEGVNTPLCDVLAKIIRESLHPAHTSAFCQRLLCCERMDTGFICLPCHRNLISDEVVWTESLFRLFQHILTRDVHLTPDTIDRLVSILDAMDCKFSKSLKFGNFLLCLVTKCGHATRFHKSKLMRIAERTDTFVTKSILAKLV